MSIENPENKIEQKKFEENPFEEEAVSKEWINSVENETDSARDRQIYPRLASWINEVNPNIVVEIGAGQGICSNKMNDFSGKYIGIEPAQILVARAEELYKNKNRDFIVGNAYNIPLPSECCDASFAINVWFHLEDINKATNELARILKTGGKFLIITVNPKEYASWLEAYEDTVEDGKKVIGKANLPINPLSKNTLYRHSMEEIQESIMQSGLIVTSIEPFDFGKGGAKCFMQITGEKK